MEASSFDHKRANIEVFAANNDEVSKRYESYDVRDETIHASLGHLWVPVMLRVYHDSRSVAETVAHCRNLVAQSATEYLSKEAARALKP
jgi:hypothetical protein